MAPASADEAYVTPTSGYFVLRNGSLWIATDWRWFTNPNFILKGIARDRDVAIKLYCTASIRLGNPDPKEFVERIVSDSEMTYIHAKYPLRDWR